MRNLRAVLALLILFGVCYTQIPQYNIAPIKKGLTLQATVFPSYENNWAGRFSCNNCNPFEGDTLCNRTLPLLCLTNARKVVRPYYNIAIQYTPFTVTDGGYYDGWTGGLLQVTTPVQGSAIASLEVGNKICRDYFGETAKWAQFDDGYYMPYMNQNPQKTWSLWDWAQTKRGGWNMWGYFNHRYRGRAWVWINNQPNANCGN